MLVDVVLIGNIFIEALENVHEARHQLQEVL